VRDCIRSPQLGDGRREKWCCSRRHCVVAATRCICMRLRVAEALALPAVLPSVVEHLGAHTNDQLCMLDEPMAVPPSR
jgi:hypothetical protein